MKATNVESLFGLMDEANKLLQTEAELSYIEALSETLENLSFEGKAQQVEGLPSNEAIERLNSLYKKMNLDALDKEIIRKDIFHIAALNEHRIGIIKGFLQPLFWHIIWNINY